MIKFGTSFTYNFNKPIKTTKQSFKMNTYYEPQIKNNNNNIFNNYPIQIHGQSLKTFSYTSPNIERIQLLISSEGRPIDSNLELWNGPGNIPFKLRLFSENGLIRPLQTVVEIPKSPNTIAIKNIAQIEFPIETNIFTTNIIEPSPECLKNNKIIQGGALRTYNFEPQVNSIQILLTTDGRPLNSRIELFQGPNNIKQIIELYTENGFERPFFCILETPGSGNVIRIVNTSPVEFPLYSYIVPNLFDF